jgi:hypothetical protein
MKVLLLLPAAAILLLSAGDCNKKKNNYRGRLEIKGMCMNYTISMLGDADTSLVAAAWTDEHTGKAYTNVFKLGSPCTFPSSIEVGDEFDFTIDTTKEQSCMVCMAYYPTPPRALRIRVLEK